jgi:hypothetical protein
MPPLHIQPPISFRNKDGALPFVTLVCRSWGHSILFHAFHVHGYLDDSVIIKEPPEPTMHEISFSQYRKLRLKGASAEVAYLQAKKDGLSDADRIKMLISIYQSSYEEVVRISRAAADSPPSMLEDPGLAPAVRVAVSRVRKKGLTRKPPENNARDVI